MSQKLIDEFHTRLEEPLILAITNEHDLENPQSFAEARGILLKLAQDPTEEEAAGFAAHGVNTDLRSCTTDSSTEPTSSHAAFQRGEERCGAGQSSSESCNHDDDAAGDDAIGNSRVDGLQSVPNDLSVATLVSMFPGLGLDQIRGALNRSAGDLPTAMDELLAVAYVEPAPKKVPAIDAFFKPEDENTPLSSKSKKKKKKKGKNAQGRSESVDEADLGEKAVNEILFISERLDIPYDMATEAYRENNCSQGATTVAILDDYISQGVEAQGKDETARLQNLQQEYKHVPLHYLSVIIQITGSVDGWLEEVARLVNKYFSVKAKGPLQIPYTLTPIEDEVESGLTPAKSTKGTKPTPKPVSYLSSASKNARESRAVLTKQVADYEAVRASAHASTLSSIKRGKSDPLYLAAASVYSERAREYSQKAREMRTQLAYQTVNERRTTDSIDLHGVTVNDGVQIALNATQSWYNGLGEYRAREAKKGFTIITGKGRHSQGGVSLMRRAIYPALCNAGWKVRDEGGKYIVEGRK
ncbi:hypothetical protein jhhlp_003112 [Lomentospora prolificans]|uniref:Smr domain-containing protein n=1 Tax=Lomentospora prolificans TaxID=41688 RepID=A0A2N3NFY2_9PEZI|nr:hypothetical protein jhhlp_003112 [Lomentospora prolificans]